MSDPIDVPPGERSQVAVAGHPIHPMLITFPVAFLSAVLASDVAYWLTGDVFWAIASLWLVGAGSVMGTIAGIAGTVEVLAVPGIRKRVVSWSHFIASVMLLSIAYANWAFRLTDPVEAVFPWGLYLSALGMGVLGLAGWLGGHLVFHHQIGIESDNV